MREREITLTVTDWPAFGKTMTANFDESLYPDADALGTWAEGRFGPGRLVADGEDDAGRPQYRYEREVPARGLWSVLGFVLNRSLG